MAPESKLLVIGLVGVLVGDGTFNAVAFYPIAESTQWGQRTKEWSRKDLDHLGFPEGLRFVFPIIKAASAAGLVMGFRRRALGRFTAAALVAYFVLAVGYHLRASDRGIALVPASAMLAWCVLAFNAFKSTKTA